jgi:hypothetical protein
MLQARSLPLRARKKSGDLTTATVPAGTVVSRATAGTRDRVTLLRGDLLFRPVELGSIDPHAVQKCARQLLHFLPTKLDYGGIDFP